MKNKKKYMGFQFSYSKCVYGKFLKHFAIYYLIRFLWVMLANITHKNHMMVLSTCHMTFYNNLKWKYYPTLKSKNCKKYCKQLHKTTFANFAKRNISKFEVLMTYWRTLKFMKYEQINFAWTSDQFQHIFSHISHGFILRSSKFDTSPHLDKKNSG